MKTDFEFGPLEVEVKDNDVIRAYRRLKKLMLRENVMIDIKNHERRQRNEPKVYQRFSK